MPLRRLLIVLIALAVASPATAEITAYRFTDLDLRDPHAYMVIPGLGCADVTNLAFGGAGINPNMQSSIQGDAEPDGLLDVSYLLLFDPVDPGSAGGVLTYRPGDCTAPMAGTTCAPGTSASQLLSFSNLSSGLCLQPIAGTTTGTYSPAITSPAAPCFVAGTFVWTMYMAGIPLMLRDAEIAATYGAGTPPGTVVNGLIRGFLTESDANNTTIPFSYPLAGGQALSSILPGGTNSCISHSAKDVKDGVTGWWFYFNFTAEKVSYTGGPTGISGPIAASDVQAFPNPFRPSVSLRFSIPVAGSVSVSVVDAMGREVKRVADGWMPAGAHEMKWDGRDERGSRVPAGVYFLRAAIGASVTTQRVVLLR